MDQNSSNQQPAEEFETLLLPSIQNFFAPGTMFGKYKIEKELGQGGMGVVYQAYDTKLNIFVALKVLLYEQDVESAVRFLREASAIAQLNHPNIIRFYEAGETPKPYFTMEYIEGWTLAQLIKEKKVKPLFLIETMIKLSEALYLAHKNKILHRDIKPSNIMITKRGEPKIMDFGLAKMVKNVDDLSQAGQPLGTILYMPPEQIEGNATIQSDIYSIGATMYEAITFRPLFQGDTHMNLMYQLVNEDPIPPRELNPDISPYLEAVCLKCVQKKPRKRYSDFGQLARELKNLKAQRPIIAKKYTSLNVLQNFIAKHKIICASIFLSFITIFAALIITIRSLNYANEQKKRSDELSLVVARTLKHITIENRSLFQDPEYLGLFQKILEQAKKAKIEHKLEWMQAIVLGYSENKEEQQRGVDYFNNLLKTDPKNAKAYTNRGVLYVRYKKYQEAERDYSKAIEINPKAVNAYSNRGNLYNIQKKYKQAERDFNKAIAIKPKHPKVYLNRALLYARQQRHEEAERDFNKAIDINPENVRAYYNRGLLFARQQKNTEAIRDFNKAIELNPKHVSAYYNRSIIHAAQKKYHKAQRDYTKIIELKPTFVEVYYNRAMLLASLPKYKLAIKDLSKFIELSPNNTMALYKRGCIYYLEKDYKKAEKDFQQVIKIDFKNLKVYERLGFVYYEQKRYKEAIRIWQEYIVVGGPKGEVEKLISQARKKIRGK